MDNQPTDDESSSDDDLEDLPDSIDWRTKGAITPVKNQGQCSSATALPQFDALKAYVQIATGTMEDLSFEQFMDCANQGQGCSGSFATGSLYDYAQKYGFEDVADYS